LDARSICNLGRIGYREGLRIQREQAALREKGEIGDTLLLCEHDPVYTLGTNADRDHVLRETEVEVVRTDRGGEVTYHGPGQVVGYAICDLGERGKDLHRFCRDLEEVMIRALSDFGIGAARVEGLTGAWVGKEKIGALGVRVRRWISTHGFALNASCDLKHYDAIIPCGIFDRGVTCMKRVLGRPVGMDEVFEACGRRFSEVFLGS
jgi:lipoate-protein ligase B